MQSIEFDLPEALQRYIQSRVEQGDFADAGEYLQALVWADQKTREALAPYTTGSHVESLVLEGLDSGDAGPMTRKDWDALRRPFQQQLDASAEE